jgi:hypothetical protein
LRTWSSAHRRRSRSASEPGDAVAGACSAVVGGLLFSQLITLYITTGIYTYLDPYNKLIERRLSREERPAGDAGLAPAR